MGVSVCVCVHIDTQRDRTEYDRTQYDLQCKSEQEWLRDHYRNIYLYAKSHGLTRTLTHTHSQHVNLMFICDTQLMILVLFSFFILILIICYEKKLPTIRF